YSAPFTGGPSARTTLTVPTTRPLVAAETTAFHPVDHTSAAAKPPEKVPLPAPPSVMSGSWLGSAIARGGTYASVSLARGTTLSSVAVARPVRDPYAATLPVAARCAPSGKRNRVLHSPPTATGASGNAMLRPPWVAASASTNALSPPRPRASADAS